MPRLRHGLEDASWFTARLAEAPIPTWGTLDGPAWEAYRFRSAATCYLVRLAMSTRLAQLHPATEVYQGPDFASEGGQACQFLSGPPRRATRRKLSGDARTSQIGWSAACG